MNLLAARVVLRQRSLADTLDLALPFCLANKRPLAVLSVVVLGPLAALTAYLRIARHWPWPALWAVCLAWSLLFEGVFTVALGELLFKPPAEVRVRTFLARFFRRFPAIVVAVTVRQVVLAFAVSLVIFPVFIVAPSSIFVPEAVLLEGATLGKALARSRALARNRGGTCIGIWLASLLLIALGAVAMDVLVQLRRRLRAATREPDGRAVRKRRFGLRRPGRAAGGAARRRGSASSATSTFAPARKVGTSSFGSSRWPSRTPCGRRRAA